MNILSAIETIRDSRRWSHPPWGIGVFTSRFSLDTRTGASWADVSGCIVVVVCDMKYDSGVGTIRPQLPLNPCDTMAAKTNTPEGRQAAWTFLTNHAHVLICIHQDHSIRTREIAERVGITERAVQRIVSELGEAGYLTRERDGRRNRYTVHAGQPLRHPVEAHCLLSSLLKTVEDPSPDPG